MSTVKWPDGETKSWTGFNRALCYTCRRVFGGASGFDKHRRGNKCLDPAMLGMTEKDGIWVQEYPESGKTS